MILYRGKNSKVRLQIPNKQAKSSAPWQTYCNDTPASNALWGFKEEVAFAQKCCRTCNGERPAICENFCSGDFERQSLAEHKTQCTILKGKSHFKTSIF